MADPFELKSQTGVRLVLGALTALVICAGFGDAPQAQERPYWEQPGNYGDRQPAAPSRPRRDDAYRAPETYGGPPGGFGSQPAPYDQGQSQGGQQPYDAGRRYDNTPAYGGAPGRDYSYERPAYGAQPPRDTWSPPPQRANDAYSPPGGQRQGGWSEPAPAQGGGNYGYGEPYAPPPSHGNYGGPPPSDGQGYPGYGEPPRRTGGTYSQNEVVDTGHRFFGSISQGLANAVERVFKSQGRPNGYILGEDAGGAFLAGLRYGEGMLHTKDAGNHKVYWQGPSLGYDFGGEGSKTMVLVYNLRDPSDIYTRFGGVQGSAYLIGGISVQFQKHEHVTLAVIRSGVGLRLGANVGYLKYTPRPTWNPF